MTGRQGKLAENEPLRALLQVERYMRERKTTAQRIGTFNVRSELVGPLEWTGPLSTASPQSPSIGMAFLKFTVTSHVMDDLFTRLITKLYVGGTWYRPSDQLIDQKAGRIAYQVQLLPVVVGVNVRNERSWWATISGPLNATVTLDIWSVSLGGGT